MKHLFFVWFTLLLAMICFYSCSSRTETLQAKTEQSFIKCAQKAVEGKKWMSFRIGKNMSSYTRNISFNFDTEAPAIYYISHDSLEIWKIDNERISIVNLEDRDLLTLNKETEMYGDYIALFENWMVGVCNYYQFAKYELQPKSGEISLKKKTDTIIEGTLVKQFVGKGKLYACYDGMTGELCYRYRKKFHYWIDGQTYQIDSVICMECRLDDKGDIYSENSKESYRLTDFCYADKSLYFDSVFDYSSFCYVGFSRYDEDSFPYGSQNDSLISDVVQNFPFVDCNGDTVCIADHNGWLLLDVWSFHCKPCIEHLCDIKAEKDTFGCRKMESDSIRIYAVNYHSDNMNLIREIADKTASHDIIYSGKHLNTLIHIPSMGYCYLLAPNKDVVFKGNYDYYQIIQAKANYEKQQ